MYMKELYKSGVRNVDDLLDTRAKNLALFQTEYLTIIIVFASVKSRFFCRSHARKIDLIKV